MGSDLGTGLELRSGEIASVDIKYVKSRRKGISWLREHHDTLYFTITGIVTLKEQHLFPSETGWALESTDL